MTALRNALTRLRTALADAWWCCVAVWHFATATDQHPDQREEGE